jgi:hypothetical protein
VPHLLSCPSQGRLPARKPLAVQEKK